LQGASPEPESEPEILVIKEDKKRVPAGKEAAIEAEVCAFLLFHIRTVRDPVLVFW
jgi:hypothetical protein